MSQKHHPGPLSGVRIIEVAGLGAGPYAGMLLSDLGADLIRVDRPGTALKHAQRYALSRGRASVTLDLKRASGRETLLSMVEAADVIFEGFRPGVAEKLGFGPDECLRRNPRLVYGRMTGWGQTGPMSAMAGHDLNYLALTGALTLLQRPGAAQPATPPGFIADMGGGGLFLALGVVAALHSATQTGRGQVIDAAMVDGVASMTTLIHSMRAQGRWDDASGVNANDGSSPFYDTYATRDGHHMAVAPIEPQFYAEMVRLLGYDLEALPDRDDPANWPELKKLFSDTFRTRTRADWEQHFFGSDACVSPVLTFAEAPLHPHNAARSTYVEAFGVVQPAPAPRLASTPLKIAGPPPVPGGDTRRALERWGFSSDHIAELLEDGGAQEVGDLGD